jgi:hypothetical protein
MCYSISMNQCSLLANVQAVYQLMVLKTACLYIKMLNAIFGLIIYRLLYNQIFAGVFCKEAMVAQW